MKDLTKCVLITATLFVLYSCMDKNGLNGAPEPTPEPEKPSVEDYFDFNTMQTIKVNIDYGSMTISYFLNSSMKTPQKNRRMDLLLKKRI